MKKSFYVVVFGSLCLSALMLGFSYARESGTNQETFLNQEKKDDFRVIFSDEYISTSDENGTDISVINYGEKETEAILVLKVKDDGEIKDDLYYSINDGKVKKLTSPEISIGTLKNYGIDGDHMTFNIKVTGKSEEATYLVASIKKEDRKMLLDILQDKNGIYTDEAGNKRYFGSTADNYINYEGTRYRMIGIFGDKIRLTTDIMDESDYETAKSTGTLVSYEDYLKSFSDAAVDENLVKSSWSWLREQQFWLQDSKDGLGYVASAKLGIYTDDNNKPHNNRYVKEIDNNCYYVSGDGTSNSPYEVAYGS